MPQTRKVEGFGRRYLLGNLAYVVPMLVCLWIVWRSASASRFDATFWLGLAGFFGFFILGVWLDVVCLRRFRCPECRARLPRNSPKPGERWLYFCARCDTIWETGMMESG